MDYRNIIKEIGRGKNHARSLDRETARALYNQMLDGNVPELEMGAILIALRIKGEGEEELRGFYDAMQQHTIRLTPPVAKPLPIVIPSYNGARKQANLTPLLAMLLSRLGFPVLVHGVSDDPTRVLTETIFTLMGVEPTHHAGQAQAKLEGRDPVYMPVRALCAPLETQLAMRWRLGVRNSAHTLAKTRHTVWRDRGAAALQRFAPGICHPGGAVLYGYRRARVVDARHRGARCTRTHNAVRKSR